MIRSAISRSSRSRRAGRPLRRSPGPRRSPWWLREEEGGRTGLREAAYAR
jgi:hypothetical protein